MNLTPGKLWGLRRMADERGIFKMTAVDQRHRHAGEGLVDLVQVDVLGGHPLLGAHLGDGQNGGHQHVLHFNAEGCLGADDGQETGIMQPVDDLGGE